MLPIGTTFVVSCTLESTLEIKMAEQVPERIRVSYRGWPGLITDIDPHDLPPGAAAGQVNVVGYDAAQMQTRMGLRELQFEN